MLWSLRDLTRRLRKTETAARLLRRKSRLGEWTQATRAVLHELEEARDALRSPPSPPPLPGALLRDAPSLSEHVAALVDRRLKQLLASIAFQDAEDPVEALHELRVASRRLRAFLDVFEPLLDPEIRRSARRPLGRIARAGGALRDWDVRRALLEEHVAAAATDAERGALEHVLEDLEVHRRKVQKQTLRVLRKVEVDAVRHSVRAALGDVVSALPEPGAPTAQFAWTTLTALAADAQHDAEDGDQAGLAERMHETRLALKRLRYGLEVFEPVLRPGYAPLHERVVALQESLGAHHDRVVLGELVEQHRAHLERHQRRTLTAGLGDLERRLAAERSALERDFSERGFDAEAFVAALRDALTDAPPGGAPPAAPPAAGPLA